MKTPFWFGQGSSEAMNPDDSANATSSGVKRAEPLRKETPKGSLPL